MARLIASILAASFFCIGILGILSILSTLAPVLSASESTCCFYLSSSDLATFAERIHTALVYMVFGLAIGGFWVGVTLVRKD